VSAVYEKQQQIHSVRFQVHMVLNIKTDFWNVMLCSLMKKHQCLSGIHSFHFHVRRVPFMQKQKVPPKHWHLSDKQWYLHTMQWY
jgi:hypothetical protein